MLGRNLSKIQGDRTDVSLPGADRGRRLSLGDERPVHAGPAAADLDIQLPASPWTGRVIDSGGQPVKGAWVYLATPLGDAHERLAERKRQWPDQKLSPMPKAVSRSRAVRAVHDHGGR